MSSSHGIIKLRRGTAAEWAASLPQPGGEVLKLGEPGYEKDTRKLKIGDGVTSWNSLPYFGNGAIIDPEDLQDLIGNGFLVAGTGINLSYNDNANSLTISASGISFSGHTHSSTDIIDFSTAASASAPVQSVAGRTGIVTLNKNDVNLANVDNTSDANKPVSTAQAAADSAVQTAASSDATTKASAAQAYSIQRSNHTGTQEISTINGLQSALDNKATNGHIHDDRYYTENEVDNLLSGKQVSGNYAILVNGTVPSNQLPSYVDDVLEFANLAAFPSTGEVSKIYIALDSNKTYRWGGSTYIEISASPGSTDAVPEGSVNKYYTDTRASAAAPVQSVAGKTGTVTLTKSDVGLANVDNTSDINKPVSTAQAAADSAVQSAAATDAATKANAAQAFAVQRSNHTGTQAISTISGLQSALDAKSATTHTHTVSQITDFNSAVSGLLPTITNNGNNRILTSDGTSVGIVAEDGFIFDNSTRQFKLTFDPSLGHIFDTNDTTNGNIRLESYGTSPTLGGIANRIVAFRDLGSALSPSGLISNNAILSLRGDALSSSGDFTSVCRLLMQAAGSATGNNLYIPTQLTLSTSSGPNRMDNTLILYSDGKLASNGYMTIEDGLSSPTPIFSLGTVSGNTAISYDVDRQIQKLTLNGTAVNFTEGTGWDVSDRSMDVMLEITVSSTTTVSFDSNFVTDWYNPAPTFSSGKYLVLLRSMGTGVVQGHYIGVKTN